MNEKKTEEAGRPFLAPATPEALRPYGSSPSGITRPVTASMPAFSTIEFKVTPDLSEVQRLSEARGWPAKGFTTLAVAWIELHWTCDGWKTTHVLRSTDVPCPVVNGSYFLPHVPSGTEVEFAVHVGITCHAPQDTAGERDRGDFWFNNDGANYRQTSR